MASLAQEVSNFSLPGLAQIAPGSTMSIAEWLISGSYQIAAPLQKKAFVLQTFKQKEFLTVLATEANRLGIGAVETWCNVSSAQSLPKSRGWTVIKCYYSSFFAANFLLALFGQLVVRLDAADLQRLATLAQLYLGSSHAIRPEKGFYVAKYDPTQGSVEFRKIGGTSGGTHEQLWKVFNDQLSNIVSSLYSTQPTTQDRQAIAVKLDRLATNLAHQGVAHSAWLSKIRNEVNYAQRFGVWFPYKEFKASYPDSLGVQAMYELEPMEIDLDPPGIGLLERFFRSAAFLTSMCISLSKELSVRIAVGKSFVEHGVLALVQLRR